MTTFDPGASEVLTQGLERRPRTTALRARMPAPTITDGLDVFVQLVIAAITTWPWSSSKLWPSTVTGTATRLRCSVALPDCAGGSCGAFSTSGSCPGAPFAGGSEAG